MLNYVKPKIGENRFGGYCITYEGVGGTKKWERLDSYGPKFVENIVQATARDILCYAMKTLRCCSVTMHTPPHKATFNRNASAKLIAYRERYCKPPKERPMLCTDVRIPTDLPQKAFCRAWNLIVAKKLRYQATLRSTVDNAEDILVRYRAEEMCLLIDEIGKINEFSYPLMLKTLDRVVVNANGKLTFIFQSGIKITV